MTRTTDINVERLYVSAVNVSPIERDWSSGHDFEGYHDGEHGWTFYESVRIEDGPYAGMVTDGSGSLYEETGEWIDADDETRETIDERRDGPMMNYAYPLPHFDKDADSAAQELVDLPLCIVRDGESYFLALTGGGMDLSWEICEAYMRLGYLPPAHYADLPGMADRGTNDTDRAIIAACRRTAEVLHSQADRLLSNLDRMGS